MAKITQIFLLISCCLLFSCKKDTNITLGTDNIKSYLTLIKGKKIAVIGNQTSMISNTHLVDSLLSLDIEIVKVFSPEHGFRGKADAGETVKDGIDHKTKLPIISLFIDIFT